MVVQPSKIIGFVRKIIERLEALASEAGVTKAEIRQAIREHYNVGKDEPNDTLASEEGEQNYNR